MSTMKEVAERARVSVSSVSHVINNTRFVSPDARARIEAAIAELAYVPSAVARSLRHDVTHTIGMLLPNSSNPYFAEVLREIESRCFAAGFNLILCNTDDDPRKQASYLRVLVEKRVDGIILVTAGEDADLRKLLTGFNRPLVIVDREILGVDSDLVEVDHANGAALATRHLTELGHRRIACIAGPLGLAPSDERIAGWQRACHEAKLSEIDCPLLHADFASQGGYAAMRELLAKPVRPSAVFVANDLMAIGALCAVHEANLRVPEDISVIGFDDIELAAFSSPPLTTVAQPKSSLGQATTELLLERIQSRRRSPARRILQAELKLRQSTARYHPAK
ncbi:substrate-binding domain-containing protein [Chitinimonas sp.]|uniref:substrate-binding domain-containing protein n=1 Tax=Chitinimonas sp. TaxID=1934313 RepID=UPI002F929ACC